jgi:predicted metal-dependent RNase
MRVGFYGAVEGVMGSCFLLEAENKQNPKKVFLIHGEREKMTIFAQKLKESVGFDAYIPTYGELLEL